MTKDALGKVLGMLRQEPMPSEARSSRPLLPRFHLHLSQDTVTGFLLAGCGHRTAENQNFLVVDSDTSPDKVEHTFKEVSGSELQSNKLRKRVSVYYYTTPIPPFVRSSLRA